MKKCLIMLTSEYPFGKGETFLESEINHHTDNFEKIIILAIDLAKNAPETRETPDNTDYYNVTPINKKFGRISDVLLGSLSVFKKSKFYNSDKDVIEHNLFKRVFFEYFCHRAKREYKYCLDKLKQYDFSEYDEVVIYSYWYFVASLIGCMLKENLKKNCNSVKFISRCHNYDVYGELDSLKRFKIEGYLPLREYILERLDKLFPCSYHAEMFLKERYPQFTDKISCSYLGTHDCGVVENRKKKNTLNIVSCSYIVGRKRVDKIVEALELLDNSEYEIAWTHIGSGPLSDNIQKLAELKLKRIKFNFAGHILNKDICKNYFENHYDLMINVSKNEGVPVAVMEAISFGTPVIATDVGGVKELIENDYNGKLLDKDFSPHELADLIKEFASMNTEEIEVFRNNSRAKWTENFDSSVNYHNFSDRISKL